MGEAVAVRYGDEVIRDLLHGPCPLVAGDPARYPVWDGGPPAAWWVDPDDPGVWVSWRADQRWVGDAVPAGWMDFCRGEPVRWPVLCAALLFLNPHTRLDEPPPATALLAVRSGWAALLGPQDREPFRRLGSHGNDYAEQVRVSGWTRVWLVRHPAPAVRAVVAAACTGVGDDVTLLARLGVDPDPMVRTMVAGNRHTPLEWLTRLAQDSEWGVRLAVAANPASPPDLLVWLDAGHSGVAAEVARRADAPDEALRTLAEHPDPLVRSLAIPRVALDPATAQRLAGADRPLSDWEALARNPATPGEVLAVLADRLLARLGDGARRATSRLPVGRGPRPHDPGDLRGLSWVATHPNTPAEVLRRLGSTPALSGTVCWTQVAEHPNTPDDVLRRLAGSTDYQVRTAARTTRHALRVAPAEYAAAFTARHRGDSWPLRHFADRHPPAPEEPAQIRTAEVSVRVGSAQDRRTPPAVLWTLAFDPNEGVRHYLAGNPATPPEVLHMLATDDDEEVRRAVAANPRTPTDDRTRLERRDDRLDVVADGPRRRPPASDAQLDAEIELHAAQPWPSCLTRWASCQPTGRTPEQTRELLARDLAAHRVLTDAQRPDPERLAAAVTSQQVRETTTATCRLHHFDGCILPVLAQLVATTTQPQVLTGVLDVVRAEINATCCYRAMGQWIYNSSAGQSLAALDQAAASNPVLDMATVWDPASHALWHEAQDTVYGEMPPCPRCGE